MPASPSHPRLPLAEGASTTIEQSLMVKIEFRHEKRRAISPILATVLTIAMALVASFAVGGFVFGTISQSQNTPLITVSGQSLPASAFVTGGSTTTITCATIPSGAYLSLTNTGSAKGTVAGVTITWAGTTNAFTLTGGCTVGALGSSTATSYINFPSSNKLTAPGAVNALSGGKFTGTVTLSGGVRLVFTGAWG